MERVINTMEENPHKENIAKYKEMYTIEDYIVIIEKAVKAMKPEQISAGENYGWRAWLHRIYKRANKGYRERDYGKTNKQINIQTKSSVYVVVGGGWRLLIYGSKKVQELIGPTLEELTKDDLVEMSTSKPVWENEKKM